MRCDCECEWVDRIVLSSRHSEQYFFFFFFKESLIAFILSRIWRLPGDRVGLSPHHGPVPAPPVLSTFNL